MFVCALYFVSSFLTVAWFELLAGWMSRSVHLKDRKAAYHVRNRQATDICHLQSFISLLPASVPPANTHVYTLAQIHTLLLAQCPHFRSISATYLSHHSNRSLRHSSFLYCAGEWKEWDGEGGGGGIGDELFILADSHVLKGAALAAKKTFFWHVSNWYFETAAHSAEVMRRFPSSADREMRVWRSGWGAADAPGAVWGLETSPAAIIWVVLSISIHLSLIIFNVAHTVTTGRHYHHNLHKCHSSSSSSLFVRLLKGFQAPVL